MELSPSATPHQPSLLPFHRGAVSRAEGSGLLSETLTVASRMPAVAVMDLAMSSPAQQPHHSVLPGLGLGRDAAGQASHRQRPRTNIGLLGSPEPPGSEDRKGGSEGLNLTPGVTQPAEQSQTQIQAPAQVQSQWDLDVADIHCVPTVCQRPGDYKLGSCQIRPPPRSELPRKQLWAL